MKACLFLLRCALLPLVMAGCAAFTGPLDWSSMAPDAGLPSERVEWAKPLDGGPLRVVFVAPRHAWGDARALAERLDASITPIAPSGESSEGTWPEGLREALSDDPEVIILSAFATEQLPADAIEAILARVRGGTGLILAHYGEGMAASLESAVTGLTADDGPMDLLALSGGGLMPEWRRGLYFTSFGVMETGRVALLDYAGGRPVTHALLSRTDVPREMQADHRESWLGLMARVVYWSSGRTPSVSITGIRDRDDSQWDERAVPPELPEEFIQTMREATVSGPTRTFEVSLDEPAPRGLMLEWQLRDPTRRTRIRGEESTAFAEGARQVAFPVSALAGSYYLDIWLTRRGRVVDWRTQAVTIDAWPVIHEVAFSHTQLKPHDILGIRVTVPPTTGPVQPVTIHARALDGRWNADGSPRVVAEGCIPGDPAKGPIALDLNLVDLISPTLRVEVYAGVHPCDLVGPLTRARSAFAVREFTVQVEQEENFPLIADGPLPTEYGLLDAYRTLSERGVSTLHLESGPALLNAIAQTGLRPMPRLHEEWSVRSIAGGLPDLGASTALQESAWWSAREGSRDAVLETPGLLTPREALARLPGFEERFAQLRGETGATGAVVDQVVLHLLADREGLDQIALGLIEVEEVAPALRLGLALAPNDASFLRADWAGIAPGLTFAGSRPERIFLRRMSSYLPATGRTMAYTGFEGEEISREEAARWAWQARTRGASGIWHRGRGVPGDRTRGGVSLLNAAGQPSLVLEGLMEGVSDLRNGYGMLLAQAGKYPAPIVIVDSRSSFWLNEADPLFPGNTLPSMAAWLGVLEDLGYPCRFISSEALSDAALEDAAVVVLPMARALGNDAWRVLTAFAERGGMLIADVMPATHDGLGGARPVEAVAALFGVSVSNEAELPIPREAPIRMAADTEGAAAVTLENLVLDPAVQPASAIAFGGDEAGVAWLAQSGENGTRLLLNHPLLQYDSDDADPASAALREWLGTRLAEAGLEPVLRLQGDERLPAGTEHAHFAFGGAHIMALLGPAEAHRAQRVVLDLGDAGHVYNLRTGERYSNPSRVRVTMDGRHATLLSVLPYRIEEVEVVSPSEVTAGRRLEVAARVVARDELPGRHLLRLEVSTLEGEVLPHYTRHLEAAGGTLRTYVPLARNETPGWYRLTVRDLVSGVTAESRFVVLPQAVLQGG